MISVPLTLNISSDVMASVQGLLRQGPLPKTSLLTDGKKHANRRMVWGRRRHVRVKC